MDDDRYQQLLTKRDEEGLSDDEANELGRMIAEREGQEYSNAEERDRVLAEEREAEPEAWEAQAAEAESEAQTPGPEKAREPKGDEPEELGGKRSPRPAGAATSGGPPPAEADEEYSGPAEEPRRSEPPSSE